MANEESDGGAFREKTGLKRKLTGPPRLLLGKSNRSPGQDEKKSRKHKQHDECKETPSDMTKQSPEMHELTNPESSETIEHEGGTCMDLQGEGLEATSNLEENVKKRRRRSKAGATIRRIFSCVRKRKELGTKAKVDHKAYNSIQDKELLTHSEHSEEHGKQVSTRNFKVRIWRIFKKPTSESKRKREEHGAGRCHETFTEISCADPPDDHEQQNGSSRIDEDETRIHDEICSGAQDSKSKAIETIFLEMNIDSNAVFIQEDHNHPSKSDFPCLVDKVELKVSKAPLTQDDDYNSDLKDSRISPEDLRISPDDPLMCPKNLQVIENPQMPPKDPRMSPEVLQMSRKDLQMSLENPQMSLKDPQMSPEDPQLSPECPCISPKNSHMSLKDLQMSPENLRMSPKDTWMYPEDHQVSPGDPQISPEDPQMSPKDLQMYPEDHQMSPEDPRISPEDPQMSLKDLQLSPKKTWLSQKDSQTSQEDPEISSENPQMSQKDPQMSPKDLQMYPEDHQVSPGDPQISPEDPQMSPEDPQTSIINSQTSHEVPQMSPEVSQTYPEVPQLSLEVPHMSPEDRIGGNIVVAVPFENPSAFKHKPIITITHDVHSLDEENDELFEDTPPQHGTLSPLVLLNGSCFALKISPERRISEILLAQTALSLVRAAISGAMEQLLAEPQRSLDQDHV
ncbi:golgin subfamily A member 6-like protein 22 [Silurus meridionalis]|uniref:golgin subfamily A member 6-like protein 22 n=1 Tax=Silurus meridionalis TaxID=175797 RepID=UPI001EEAC141|nr:golgin subfamily A member 6-like protein 22 [Silurus meridionalis]